MSGRKSSSSSSTTTTSGGGIKVEVPPLPTTSSTTTTSSSSSTTCPTCTNTTATTTTTPSRVDSYKNKFKGKIPEIECDQRPLSSPPGTGGKPLPSPNSRFRSSQWSSSSVVTTSGTGNTCILQPRSQHKSSRGERRLEKTSTLPCTANPPLITSKVPPSTSSTSPTTTAPKSYSVDATTGHKLSPTRAKKAESTRPSPTSTSLRRNQRRRRSLSLCESFSDGESTDGLLRTGSFSDKVSKKWSLPVPSTTSRGSRGSESTETSYTSRSSAEVESLSGGEISPADHTEGPSEVSGGDLFEEAGGETIATTSGHRSWSKRGKGGSSSSSSSSRTRRKKWSKSAQTHSFSKIYSYVFERCRNCDTYIYLSGFKCDKCQMYSHGKCLRSSIILCGQKPLPRKTPPVFGVPLESWSSENPPYIVIKCCQEIERRGYSVKGVYRVNGHTGRIRKLVRALELGPTLVDISGAHINDLTNVLKEYFRSLPDPLFMSSLYRSFINTAKSFHGLTESERDSRKTEIVAALMTVVDKMNPSHRTTLSFLMHHLRFIADNRAINQMSAKNLGLVFAPSLFRIKDPEGHPLMEDLFDNSFQALIIELLINYCTEVFGEPRSLEGESHFSFDV